MIEIRTHGRGGQGAVVASKILADAAFRIGKYAQSFPQFGVERRGAPVVAFTRIAESSNELPVRSNIYEPDHIMVLDPTLLSLPDTFSGLKEGGWVIINTPSPPEALDIPTKYKVATVDASEIAVKYGLGSKAQPIVNTAILGAFAKILEHVIPLAAIIESIPEEVPTKPDANQKACEEAYHLTQIRI
ncbi:MAG TPA: 2-oxoacid:acceptor oxidoreductase family protein [Candidatus Hydrothermia bacterium]|nr:2-oxoacid:acceptor oxidoreductase family protein [Candidatus Hydrothermae bacterium]MDD3649302.1 2-oxoacid:acceptor oxidoreductase family protein [Candidatus Hydrothermia bacterium]MDD5572624.1 2-oxoacid:acceptor oxidoreductase family protein [Candidatus Hydrothermia bacterium]HOK22717.1 2-oxoacid:acceptor oxidoreductase family protein [Candidatus Hydrothermia bacterium]HOL23426.1 2-oxoacid:acceptor oxidoreductase family protein [Candidatus Hydrothermia bacterium]